MSRGRKRGNKENKREEVGQSKSREKTVEEGKVGK